MRNRASAQQARERKKHFMAHIEVRAKELDASVLHLESRVSLLERENWSLRALLATATTGGAAPAAVGLPRGARCDAAVARVEPVPVAASLAMDDSALLVAAC
jgi:hypothetical protein